MVLTWGGFAALPSQARRRFPRALKFFHVPPELGRGMGRTKGPIPSTLQQGGPADMPGGDSLAAPSGALSAARRAALEQQGWQEGCSTRGSPAAPGGPLRHLGVPTPALWCRPGGHSGPPLPHGVQGHRAGLPSGAVGAEQAVGLALG